MKPGNTLPMKRRRFFFTLVASAAGMVGLRHLRLLPRTFRPPEEPKVTVSINPLAVPREKGEERNG